MLHDLYYRRSLPTLNVAYENGSWVHPQLKMAYIRDNTIVFELKDERVIEITAVFAGDGQLEIVVPLPIQQQHRDLYNVHVTGSDVFITTDRISHIQVVNDGVPITDIEWLMSATDRELRYAVTNRFFLNGDPWQVPTDPDNFSIWRTYDPTTILTPEEDDEEPTLP